MKQIEEIEQVAIATVNAEVSQTSTERFFKKTPEKQNELIGKLLSLAEYWALIVKILKYAKHFTGKKTDQRIDEIIALGNDIFETEE